MSGELKEYEVTTDGGYTTTLMLSDEDAKVRGLTRAARAKADEPAATKEAAAPLNKARTATTGKS